MNVLEDEIRKRIESLRLALLEGSTARGFERPLARALAIGDVEGAIEAENGLGKYLVIRKAAGAYVSTEMLEDAARVLLGEGNRAPSCVFVDLETTGFSSTLFFLPEPPTSIKVL